MKMRMRMRIRWCDVERGVYLGKGANGETVTASHFNDLSTNARNGTASELSRGNIKCCDKAL